VSSPVIVNGPSRAALHECNERVKRHTTAPTSAPAVELVGDRPNPTFLDCLCALARVRTVDHRGVHTENLQELAVDFARRMSALGWLTDALLLSGMSPGVTPGMNPGTRTIENHVILIGPTTDEPAPLKPIERSTRGRADWVRVSPDFSGALDMNKYINTITTMPIRRKQLNILVVHHKRREGEGSVRFFLAHHEDMERPHANKKLANDEWVYDTFSSWLNDEDLTA
jgi:hypothetical protein